MRPTPGHSGAEAWSDPIPLYRDRDGWVQQMFHRPPVDVEVRIEEVGGRPELVGLRIESPSTHTAAAFPADVRVGLEGAFRAMSARKGYPEPTVLTKALLKSFPLAKVKRLAMATRHHGFAVIPVEAPESPGRGPAPLPDSRFEEVKRVYLEALANGLSPNAAVRGKFGLQSHSGASNYIRRARELGLLGWPARKGQAGASAADSPWPTTRKRLAGGSR